MPADPEFMVEGISDDAIFIDQVGHSGYAQTESAGNIVEAGDFLVVVGEKGEGEGETGAETLVAGRAVGADADQACPVCSYGFICVTEALRLTISASGEVLGVEVEDRGPAASPFGKSELLTVVAEGFEFGGYGTWLQHFPAHP